MRNLHDINKKPSVTAKSFGPFGKIYSTDLSYPSYWNTVVNNTTAVLPSQTYLVTKCPLCTYHEASTSPITITHVAFDYHLTTRL